MMHHPTVGAIAFLMSACCFAGEQQATAPATAPAPAPSSAGVIVFASDRDGDSELYRINPDGSGLTQLTDNAFKDTSPAWSPDCTRIAFVRS
jgi:Tol biopolymer transport system component